jgi:hypothetical protein
MVEDYDEYDDFDPMDDDEYSEDYYITQVISRFKKIPREKILKALDDSDWDIEQTVKLLKQREQGNKTPGKQGAKTSAAPKNTPGQVNSTTKGQNQVVSVIQSSKPSQDMKTQPTLPPETLSRKSSEQSEALRKQEESKIIHSRLNQTYPDVYPEQ